MAPTLDQINNMTSGEIGFFRFKRIKNDQYLITNDAGKFAFLSTGEFEKFISGKLVDKEKYNELLEKGFLKSDHYIDAMTGSVALKNHFVGTGPSLHMIIPTLRCNHKCKYCHAAVAPMSAVQFDMDKQTAQKVVDTIFFTNSPSITIEFQGGEALVNYEIIQYVVEYASQRSNHLQKPVMFSLVTNLTLMTEEKLTWLLDRNVGICTSLDGDQLIHNSNRAGFDGNSFQTVTYWMNRLGEEKQKRNMGKVGALLTVTKETLPRYKEIIDTYVGLGLEGIFLRWLNPYGFAAADMKTLAYENEDWLDFYKKSLDYIIELNKNGTLFMENITSVYLMKIFSGKDPAFMDIRSPSGLAIGGVAYNYDGKVYASDESRMLGRMGDDTFLMTDMLDSGEETYRAMMNSDIAKIAIQSTTLDGLPGYNEHVYKPYIGVDIIHNYQTTGSVYTPIMKDKKMQLQIGILDYIFEKLQNPEDEKILRSWMQ